MKKKYTLSIADMEINVVTDEPQESVEYIVGILDRKMREIALKSKRCTKNEAALLCALDFCADKIKSKEQIEELEDELESVSEKLKNITEKLELVQQNAERVEREKARLEVENGKLRAVLDEARAGKKVSAEDIAVAGATESDVATPVGDIYAATAEEANADAKEEIAEDRPAPAQKKKNTGKNRVGSMFDLLTFSDI
ncbi:MAG: cell division protein ZapA [Clostridia bacterium]|nr:cell division protein ZapA [Clostridia bacterium]